MIAAVIADSREEVVDCLRRALESQRDVAVVGEVRRECEVLAMITAVHPDVVLLGAGLGCGAAAMTERIMREAPVPLLIVADAGAGDDAAALLLGAIRVLPRPVCPMSAGDTARLVREVRDAAQAKVVKRHASVPRLMAAGKSASLRALVGIGASTGGPQALVRVLSGLPVGFAAPVLVVQHMVGEFMDRFADWLAHEIRRPVSLAQASEIPEPGRVYVAGEHHLAVDPSGSLRNLSTPPVGGHRPSADVLFESMASCDIFGLRVGVLLTGMGRDGAAGLAKLRDAGGRTIAQDEASCLIYGMPRAAAESGAAQEVLDIEAIGARIGALVAAHTAGRAA
jgi:two-component system chemotaxis response regulator CheB